jgi:hypothetical protein
MVMSPAITLPFEHSYEIQFAPHKKVHADYDMCVAIPRSKKFLLWFTHKEGGCEDICHMYEYRSPTPPLDSGRSDKTTRGRLLMFRRSMEYKTAAPDPTTPFGTLLYGSICQIPVSSVASVASVSCKNTTFFVIEDVLLWGGNPTHALPFGIKLGIMREILTHITMEGSKPDDRRSVGLENDAGTKCRSSSLILVLPVLFPMDRANAPPLTTIPYTVHHIQYRSLTTCQPHIKRFIEPLPNKNIATVSVNSLPSKEPRGGNERLNRDPQRNSVFLVRPSTAFDIYYLLSLESLKKPTDTFVTEVAHIPDYKTSMWMNTLFRNIKENANLDAIEDSDDEDDFENIAPHKHVFLDREYYMECMYHRKFRKWIPLRVVDPPKIR